MGEKSRKNPFKDFMEAALFKNLVDKSDAFLVKQCLAGNSRAWSCLVTRYKRLIYHFPSKEGLSSEDGDEVFQETLVAFYKQMDRITQTDDLSYWLSKVAQRTTWRVVNRNLKYVELTDTYDVEDPNQVPEQNVELKVQHFKIRQGLNMLDAKCKNLLHALFYQADESEYKHISESLGIAIGSIGPTRNRCLAKFKKILSKMGVDEKNVSKWL